MKGGFGGMVAIEVESEAKALSLLEQLRVFTLAESLGAVESLAEHPALMTHSSLSPEERARIGVGAGLIRLSIGIEDIDDLIADLDQALAAS
jgi:cystathionine beta-lyase/cystathionine gamma-synthase